MKNDPMIIKYRKRKNGFTTIWKTPDHFSIKIGGKEYIPYQFTYDKNLNEYVWKFKRKGGAEAGTSVS